MFLLTMFSKNFRSGGRKRRGFEENYKQFQFFEQESNFHFDSINKKSGCSSVMALYFDDRNTAMKKHFVVQKCHFKSIEGWKTVKIRPEINLRSTYQQNSHHLYSKSLTM